MLRDLLRPTAILTHLLVLAVAVVCVAFGNWQFGRLAEVRANNQLLAERLDQPPADLAQLAGAGSATPDEQALEFRRVEVAGVYRPDEEVLQRNRDHQGQQGFHLLTPLELSDGGVVLVRRGWVPAQLSEPPVTEASPPDGTVTVTGVLERPVEQPSFGASDPEEGVLERVFHTDTARLARQIDGSLFPMVLRLETQQPPLPDVPGELPVAIPRPELDEANHLSYGVQWYSFAALAVIIYGAWLWTNHRRRTTGTTPERQAQPVA
jgi:surfeit locus 1 family protein